MSIFEKVDTARHRRGINLCTPVSQLDATGYSGVEPDAIANPIRIFRGLSGGTHDAGQVSDADCQFNASSEPLGADGIQKHRRVNLPFSIA
jgi:hypothetical protein